MSAPELDPQIIDVLRKMEESGTPPVETLTPDEVRANFAATTKELFGAVDEMHAVEDRDADGVPVRIYRPLETSEPSTALIYLHGGGWVAGSIDTYDGITRALAKRAGCIVISVEYRLAPEHVFPAALDDGWTAARWVYANAADLGIDRDRIGVGGDSSGGAIATVIARKGRDTAMPFAAQLLIYPVVSSGRLAPSYSEFSSGYGLTRAAMDWYWKQYIGEGDGSANPDVSPGSLQDMRRLPRAIVITAEADVLRDEGEAYAQRLFLSGNDTEGYRYDGMIHGFLRFAGVVDRSRLAFDEIADSLRPALEKGWREQFDPDATPLPLPPTLVAAEEPADEQPGDGGGDGQSGALEEPIGEPSGSEETA
jgi:acetyl esterase